MRQLFICFIFALVCTAVACNDAKVKDIEGKKTEKTTDSEDTESTSEESEESNDTEGSRPSPTSLAKKWCDLNRKVFLAEDEDARAKAESAREKYEQQLEEKYSNDQAFYKKIERAVEDCEDESEGRN